MKFSHQIDGRTARVTLSGDLDAGQCDGLRTFWTKHIPADLPSVEIAMIEVDGLDGPAVATLVDLIRRHLRATAEVTLHDPPQMLAHTLYKIGLLDHAGLTLINPRRDEQPYA